MRVSPPIQRSEDPSSRYGHAPKITAQYTPILSAIAPGSFHLIQRCDNAEEQLNEAIID